MTKKNQITTVKRSGGLQTNDPQLLAIKELCTPTKPFSANKDKFDFSGNITVNIPIKLMATLLMLKVTNQWV
jgi:hypothetical protein